MKKQILKYASLIVIVCVVSACGFFNVPDDGPQIEGEPVDKVALSQQQHDLLQQILTLKNPKICEIVNSYDELSSEVFLVSSRQEFKAICPDSLIMPDIDFKSHCLVYGLVATPTSRSEIKKVELYLQNNGAATFYTEIFAASTDPLVGLAFPYAVFKVSGDDIKKLKIISKIRFY